MKIIKLNNQEGFAANCYVSHELVRHDESRRRDVKVKTFWGEKTEVQYHCVPRWLVVFRLVHGNRAWRYFGTKKAAQKFLDRILKELKINP